ncbi:MAG: ferritin family protein [Spirochaetales bacterium]|nr:ferritin family protein [Spirochaetales bacterium]
MTTFKVHVILIYMDSLNSFNSMESILDFAISKELEAQETYLSYAGKTERRGLRKLLMSMVDQEKEHEKRLKELKSGIVLESVFPAGDTADIKISDYTVSTEYSPDMDYQDFLLLVIKKEDKSYRLYQSLMAKTVNDEAKLVFKQLADEEKKHKAWVQDRYDLEILTDN